METLPVFALIVATLVLVQARYVAINMNFGVILSEEPRQLSEEMIRICVKETELSMEELHQFQSNDFSNSTEAVQCFAHCIYEQMGVMKDGIFVERDMFAEVADALDPKRHIPRECRAVVGTNKCENAFRMHKCAQEMKAKRGLF